MPAVTRWFRLLVLTLLLPAYALAAVHTAPVNAAVAEDWQAGPTISSTDAPADWQDVQSLIDELGDTSDDMSDHCLPFTRLPSPTLRPAAPAALGVVFAADAPPGRLLRPPRSAV